MLRQTTAEFSAGTSGKYEEAILAFVSEYEGKVAVDWKRLKLDYF